MARKTSRGPALYELITDRGRSEPVVVRPSAQPTILSPKSRAPIEITPRRPQPEPNHEPAPALASLLSPGKVIRVPVGYVLLVAAGFIVVGFGGYMLGYQQNQREVAAQIEAKHRAEQAAIVDPTWVQNTKPIGSSIAAPPVDRAAGVTANRGVDVGGAMRSADVSGSASDPAGSATLIKMMSGTKDPRTPDLNYFVVAHAPVAEADRAAEFLAANGIPVARLLPNRNGMANVVVLIGFEGGEGGLRSDRSRDLQSRIKSLGREYRAAGGGMDFSTLWPQKYRG